MAEAHERSTTNPEVDFLTGDLADDHLPDAADRPWLAADDAENETKVAGDPGGGPARPGTTPKCATPKCPV